MGLRYGERGISEAMVPTESSGRHWGIRLTSRRGSWRWQELWEGQGLARTSGWAAALPVSPRPTAAPEPPFSPCLPGPRHIPAPLVRGSALPTPTSAGPRGRSGLGGLLGAQRAAHRPTPWRCPYPIPARARRGGRRWTELRAEGGGVAGAGRGAAKPPELRPAAQSVREQGAVPARPGGWPGSPGREAVRLPPPAPAADVTVPASQPPPSAELAPVAPPQPGRDVRARPAQLGFSPPSSTPPQPGSFGTPPTTLSLAASRAPKAPNPGSV